MYIILRSEETGFPITRTCPTSRQGDLLFLDAFWFSWFDFRRQKPTPDRSNRGCMCVRAMKCQIFRPLRAISVAKNYSYNLPIIWVFFLLLGYIILWGSHIKLVCDNFEFYFLRLGNLKLMLLRSFFFVCLRQEFFVLFQCPYVLMFMCQSI